MVEEVFIPKFGQTVEEVILVKWLVEDGARVEPGQPVLDVETDKAIFSVEATEGGYLHRGPFQEGDTLPVVTVVAVIGMPDDHFTVQAGEAAVQPQAETAGGVSAAGPTTPATIQKTAEGKVFASPRARRSAAGHEVNLAEVIPTGGGGVRVVERDVFAYLRQRPKATPLAQKLAVEAGVDLNQLTGTGPQGRIIKADVVAITRRLAGQDFTSPEPVTQAPVAGEVLPEAEILERLPLKGVRGIIAERMATSVHTTARVTLLSEVDATRFVALRERLKGRFSDAWGFAPSYNDLLVKVVAIALRHHPYLNARFAGSYIERLARIHIGIAVDTPRGLLVPVLNDADIKSLQQIGSELRKLVHSAQAGSLLPEDMSGGTFTITNLGMYDITAFTPVINLPEAAILGVGKIAPAPGIRQGQVYEYQKLVLSLVFDHRLVDGAPAARCLQFIKDLIEDPGLLITL